MEQIRKLETVIYGGAFNPPTLAHKAILEACSEYAQNQQADVWVMPSGDRSDKVISTPRVARISYTAAMIEDAETLMVSPRIITSELDRPDLIETYDTLQELKAIHPNRRFTFVFGADSTQTMASWKGGKELLEELPMLVVERPGSLINPLARHAVKLSIQALDISSTEVRRRIAAGVAIDDLVSVSVAQLLQ